MSKGDGERAMKCNGYKFALRKNIGLPSVLCRAFKIRHHHARGSLVAIARDVGHPTAGVGERAQLEGVVRTKQRGSHTIRHRN